MSAASYYPAGAYNDPRAPYNEESELDEKFQADVTTTLCRTATICSTEYEGGYYDKCEREYIPATHTGDANAEFLDQCYSITELLRLLIVRLEREIEETDSRHRKSELRNIIAEAKSWTCEEIEVEIN